MNQRKNNGMQIGMSILVVSLFGYLFYMLQYLYLPVGDDVLFQFKDSYQLYTNKDIWKPTELVSDYSGMCEEIWERWLNFSGRFTTVFFVPLLNIVGQRVCSILGSVIYIVTGMAIGRLCWNGWKEVFMHPLGIIIIYLLQYQLSPSSMYMQMWTFVCHYHFPILLYLLYYIYWKKQIEKGITWRIILSINLLGILVGATHELLPLYLFVLMGVYGIKKNKRKSIMLLIKTNIGLTVGYLFVVFAPGNIVRMQIEHDVARTQAGLVEKLSSSILSHGVAIGIKNPVVFILAIFSLYWLCKRILSRQISIKDLLLDNLEYLVAAMVSIFMWAVVAPPVGLYSLPFFKALLIIWFVRTVKIDVVNRRWYQCLAGVSIVVYILSNNWWIGDFREVSCLRKKEIEEAKDIGKDEVIVTRYPDSTSNCMTSYNFANLDGIYESEEHIKYYGIRIKVQCD